MKGAYSALPAWLVQRVSAVYMLLFLVYVLVAVMLQPVQSYLQWRNWIGHPGMSIAVLVFFIALLGHAWVGLRDVLIDYARPAAARRAMLGFLAAALVGMAAWIGLILWRAQF